MADEAIDYMNRINALTPDQPFFVYYAPGGTHAPHHPTPGVDQEDQRHAPVRRGVEQAARADLREPEEARRDPAERQADAVAQGPAEGVGPAHGRREEAVHPPGRRLRRLRRLHRPRDRPRDPGGRGPGQARQHADHLHRGRQRHERRGHARTARRTRWRCSTASMSPVEAQLKYFYDVWGSDRTYNHMAVPLGLGLRHARSPGPSRSSRTSAASARAWRSRGRR